MAVIQLTEDQQQRILNEAANGQTIRQICDLLNLERLAFLYWRRIHPDFEKRLQNALEEGVEAQVDEVCVLALEEKDMVRAKIHGEFLLKVASKRLRARYGESLHLTGEVKVDLMGVLQGIRARREQLAASASVTPVAPGADDDAIEAHYERVPALPAPDTESGAAPDDDPEDIFR